MVEPELFVKTAGSRGGGENAIDVNLFGSLKDAFLGVMFLG